MAGAAGGPGLLKSGTKGGLITRICGGLKGAQLGQYIRIGRFEPGPIGPNRWQRVCITRTAACRETCGEAFKKTDHFADASTCRTRVATLINDRLDAFHLAGNAFQAIPAGGYNVPLSPSGYCERQDRDQRGGIFLKFHLFLPMLLEGVQ